MKSKNNILGYLVLFNCSACTVAGANEKSPTLKVSFLDQFAVYDSQGEWHNKYVVKPNSRSYPVRFHKDEVQVLLGNFGWEGIV